MIKLKKIIEILILLQLLICVVNVVYYLINTTCFLGEIIFSFILKIKI